MKISLAKDESTLKERLNRFFNSKDERQRELCKFLDNASKIVDIYLFGGIFRDIALLGIKEFKSDIDLVFIGDERSLYSLFKGHNVESNKYGGKRLYIDEWMVDIWAAKKTWAIREGYFQFKSIDSLLETTITNWEAILYRWRDKQIICRDSYFADISNRHLDIVFEKNLNEFDMYARILRFCVIEPVACSISPRVESLLEAAFDKYPRDSLIERAAQLFPEPYLPLENGEMPIIKDFKNTDTYEQPMSSSLQ